MQFFVNLFRSDPLLRSIIFKLVPGLFQSECQRNCKFNKDDNLSTNNEKLLAYYQHIKDPYYNIDCDKRLLDQYFYSQDEPIR